MAIFDRFGYAFSRRFHSNVGAFGRRSCTYENQLRYLEWL